MDTFSNRRRLFGTAAWLWVVLAAGLQGQPSGSGAVWPIPDAPASLRPAIARADAIIAAMHDALVVGAQLRAAAGWGDPGYPVLPHRFGPCRPACRPRGGGRGRANQRPSAQSHQRAEILGCPARQRQCRPPRQGRRRVRRRPRRETGRPQAHRGGAEMCRLPWTGRQVRHRCPRGARRIGIRPTAPSASTTATSGGGTGSRYRRAADRVGR